MEGEHAVVNLVGTIAGLLLLAAVVLALSKRLRLPFTVLLVVVGVVLAQFAEHGPAFLHPLAEFKISPEVILFVFLPTLIFESAFNLDARQLKRNLLPVLALAVPGLLLSTAIIGSLLSLLTPIPLPAALLLGAILSATDPVAVISLFKSLGAPKRLTVLVEGESLFNDATSIVAAHILLGVAVAGYVSTETVVAGIGDFFIVFIGGVLVGWLAGLVTGFVLGYVDADPYIEISLTTILAYLSFLVAEHGLHVSGVMATVAAAITIGGWGRAKISPSIRGYLEHFWEYMAYVANALIFLLVGLQVDLMALLGSLDLLALVIVAMLLSRAVVVFGLVPMLGMLPHQDRIDRRYQAVMYWGGLRGAIALALALSLGDFEYAELFVALVIGAVLFTLLVPGLSIELLVKKLGLDIPPLAERLAGVEGELTAKHRALARIPELQAGGLFSARIAGELKSRCEEGVRIGRERLNAMRSQELDRRKEVELLLARCLAEEKTINYEMFCKGHLSEGAYRNLAYSIELQSEALKYQHRLPPYTLHPEEGRRADRVLGWMLEDVLHLSEGADRLRVSRTVRDYEQVWGRHQASTRLIESLKKTAEDHPERTAVVQEVLTYYQHWQETARARIDAVAEQLPEFVTAMQERLAERLLIHAEREAIELQLRSGAIPHGVAESMLGRLDASLRDLRGREVERLRVAPEELLRKVPFFQELPETEFAEVMGRLRSRTLPAGQSIIRQGERSDSLFLIARGVVRVSRRDNNEERDLATLIAGDFFGEMALLESAPRTATCRAVTPCVLYELSRGDFDSIRHRCPSIESALREAGEARAAKLH